MQLESSIEAVCSPYQSHEPRPPSFTHELAMSPIVEGGDVAAGPEEGNESLIYWVSWLATVSTLGLFSSGLYVYLHR